MSEKMEMTMQKWVYSRWQSGNYIMYTDKGADAVPVLVTEIPEEALPVPEFEVGQEVVSNEGGHGGVVVHPPIWARGAWIVPVHNDREGYFCIYASSLRPIPTTVTKTIRVTGSEGAVEDAIGFIDKLNSGGVTVEVSDE